MTPSYKDYFKDLKVDPNEKFPRIDARGKVQKVQPFVDDAAFIHYCYMAIWKKTPIRRSTLTSLIHPYKMKVNDLNRIEQTLLSQPFELRNESNNSLIVRGTVYRSGSGGKLNSDGPITYHFNVLQGKSWKDYKKFIGM